jgi:hypothetical protein
MTGICVVHLVWAPLGPEPLRRFIASLGAHVAGAPFRLLVVRNGFGAGTGWDAHAAALEGVDHELLTLPEPVQDLPAYRAAVDAAAEPILCFMNSYAEVLADGWLARLTDPLGDAGIGLVGASGSWESAFSSAPLVLRAARLRGFQRFPNPHVRTNGFAARRDLLRSLTWAPLDTKLEALERESGRRSLTRQIRARGLRVVLTGRDGRLYDPDDWAGSATFRAGGQRNLLVADNRTADYAAADAAERRRLARMAWGPDAPGD